MPRGFQLQTNHSLTAGMTTVCAVATRRPREGTLGGSSVPGTATTGRNDMIVRTLLTLFVVAGLGGLTALRLARRP